MLWALTSPVFDANTDFGEIDPLTVESKTIFCSAFVTSALAESAVIEAKVSVRNIVANLFIYSLYREISPSHCTQSRMKPWVKRM
jgi:hypothetical protein